MNSMTDRIRRGLSAYTAVASFGLDGRTRHHSTGDAADLGLNSEAFFSELYESRPDDEAFIRTYLRSESMSLFIVGSCGVGKTTLTYKATHDHVLEFDVPLLVIDFKLEEIDLEMESAQSWSDAQLIEAVNPRVQSLLKAQLFRYLDKHEIHRSHLAAYFLDPTHAEFLSAGLSQDLLQNLIEDFDTSLGVSRLDWAIAQRDRSDRLYSSSTAEKLSELGRSLTVRDLLYALTCKLGGGVRRRAVALFDNLDSIFSITTRRAVSRWLESEAVRYESALTFVMCVRPENLGKFRPSDLIKIHQPDQEYLFGQGATVTYKINVDPPALSRDELQNLDPEDVDDDIEGLRSKEANALVVRRRLFDDRIHRRRVDFLSRAAEAKSIPGIASEDIRAIAAACRTIRNVRGIGIAADSLANGDRRKMLASITNFLEYIVVDLGLSWEEIDRVKNRQLFILRSLYYRWLATGGNSATNPPVFHIGCFNPVAWVARSWSGSDEDATIQTDSVNGTIRPANDLLEYFVLAAVYNLMGNTVEERCRIPIPVHRVLDSFRLLGIDRGTVLKTLAWLASGGVDKHGLLETTRFHHIIRGLPLTEDDEVAATDRACELLEATGIMVNFLAELLPHHQVDPKADDAWYTDFGLIRPGRLRQFLNWIRMLGTTEARILSYIQSQPAHRQDYISEYRRLFVVDNRIPSKDLAPKPLLFERVVRSCEKHLGILQDRVGSDARLIIQDFLRPLWMANNYFRQTVLPSISQGQSWTGYNLLIPIASRG